MQAQNRHVDAGPVDGGVLTGGFGLVIEGAGQNARRGGFAHAAHAGQQIGLMDAIKSEGVTQRAHHRLLADQIFKGRWAIFARQHAIGARGGGRRNRRRAKIKTCLIKACLTLRPRRLLRASLVHWIVRPRKGRRSDRRNKRPPEAGRN